MMVMQCNVLEIKEVWLSYVANMFKLIDAKVVQSTNIQIVR